mmetsp:Transcript_98615/g.254932  ORF Transcript_98615/g.254932 Transcript_98615/m.254932 type:complete len:218 (+) Transcript_98615:575-1228(+)
MVGRGMPWRQPHTSRNWGCRHPVGRGIVAWWHAIASKRWCQWTRAGGWAARPSASRRRWHWLCHGCRRWRNWLGQGGQCQDIHPGAGAAEVEVTRLAPVDQFWRTDARACATIAPVAVEGCVYPRPAWYQEVPKVAPPHGLKWHLRRLYILLPRSSGGCRHHLRVTCRHCRRWLWSYHGSYGQRRCRGQQRRLLGGGGSGRRWRGQDCGLLGCGGSS